MATDNERDSRTSTRSAECCDTSANVKQLGHRRRQSRAATTLLIRALVSAVLLALAVALVAAEKLPQEAEGRNLLTSYQQQQAAGGAPRLRRLAVPSTAINKQLELADEQALLRRQLPELIAQAHQDKAFERALLRMLINASLRSGSAGATSASPAPPPSANWQLDNDLSLTQYNQVGGEFVPVRSARMEQASQMANPQQQLQELASLDGADLSSLTATINQLNMGQLQPLDQLTNALIAQQQQQSQQVFPAMDKREYVKPCSFNSISCVRNPFRARL